MSKERPWEAGPFESWVSDELNYRVNNLSKGISSYPNDGNKVEYSGPRKAWARVFSNGMNLTTGSNLTPDGETEWGLVFKSGNGFFERYGVSNNQNDQETSKQRPRRHRHQTHLHGRQRTSLHRPSKTVDCRPLQWRSTLLRPVQEDLFCHQRRNL